MGAARHFSLTAPNPFLASWICLPKTSPDSKKAAETPRLPKFFANLHDFKGFSFSKVDFRAAPLHLKEFLGSSFFHDIDLNLPSLFTLQLPSTGIEFGAARSSSYPPPHLPAAPSAHQTVAPPSNHAYNANPPPPPFPIKQ